MADAALRNPEPMTVEAFMVYDPETPGMQYDLVDGSLRPTAPASQVHGTIQGNLARLVGNHLLSSPCRLLTEAGMVPLLQSAVNMRIQDQAVTCEAAIPGGDPLVREPKLNGQHGTTGDIVLGSIDITLSIDDIYAKTGLN